MRICCAIGWGSRSARGRPVRLRPGWVLGRSALAAGLAGPPVFEAALDAWRSRSAWRPRPAALAIRPALAVGLVCVFHPS
jgi:hypothetical protein